MSKKKNNSLSSIKFIDELFECDVKTLKAMTGVLVEKNTKLSKSIIPRGSFNKDKKEEETISGIM